MFPTGAPLLSPFPGPPSQSFIRVSTFCVFKLSYGALLKTSKILKKFKRAN